MHEPLDTETLLAWGLDYQRHLQSGERVPLQIMLPILVQYVVKANEALAAMVRRQPRRGRPRGGMGDQVTGLVANGMAEDDAIDLIARHHGKPRDSVRRALQRHRAQNNR